MWLQDSINYRFKEYVKTQNIYFVMNKPRLGGCLINFEKIIGLQVITSGAHILGEVKGAKIDTKSWEIKCLNVKLTDAAANMLGMKKRFGSITISVPVSLVQAVAGVITLTKSLEELESGKEIEESKE
jgi:sporulation protein YlmC with PRC-barrel domain